MNPMKRKKLYRLKLKNNNAEVKQEVVLKEEKVVLKEETVPVLQEQTEPVASLLDFGLSVETPAQEAEVVETKKEKKKKWSSQDV